MGLFGQIYRDYRRYRATGGSWVLTLFFTQGFWASTVYRVNRWAVQRLRFRPLRLLAQVFLSPLNKLTEIVTGICIPASADIGEGMYIGHFGGIFFPSRGRLGRNCSVSQGVTIGQAGTGDKRGAPTIGDRVYIGPHAIVVGKITVGDDAAVCAGAVVTRPVPPRAVVAGNPARVISYDGSFEFICYDGMEGDPARLAALAAGAYPAPTSLGAAPAPALDPTLVNTGGGAP
ncbi:serine O-acetyltransferase [Urbifossiella limnaea]|uniref:Serine acetyltransferase n=1 Tax=Urbifossiella limnaea TaxID=2528023 RepID=A0A517Y370_9BACT|nr:DapH/DapD/GlmU-related protein [Urbifossiella limnaea]QDU24187.1 Serine acetyltransferase [Urbifossiella limnaea]